MAAESSVPECEEKEPGVSDVQEGDGNGTVSSAEHEDDRKEAVSSAEHKDDKKEAVSSAEKEDNKLKEEFPAENVDGMKGIVTAAAQEVGNTLEAVNPAETCNELESSRNKKSKVLRVKQKIVKKSPASCILKTDEVQSSPKKSSQNDISELKSSLQEKKNVEKGGHSDKSLKNQKHREKDNVEKSSRENKNKENFGGFISMYSTKTKSDCFDYNVMGFSASIKDSVLAIKPGIKLFLYDFDSRFLYGIYEASSSGGMELEPKAFNGAFPAQVRFKVHKNCVPLHVNVFKTAIKENFYATHKFRAELTVEQVRKLSDLFRPKPTHSSSATVQFSPRAPNSG